MVSFFRNKQSSSTQPDKQRLSPPRADKDNRWFNTSSAKQPKPQHPPIPTFNLPQPSAHHTASLHESPSARRVKEGGASGASLRNRSSRFFHKGLTVNEVPPPNPSTEHITYQQSSSPYIAPAAAPRSPGEHSSPPPPAPHTSTPNVANDSGTDSTTKSLATRLQELAISHADGLLDEEEYRLLRTELFQRYAAKAAEPSLPVETPSLSTLSTPRGTSMKMQLRMPKEAQPLIGILLYSLRCHTRTSVLTSTRAARPLIKPGTQTGTFLNVRKLPRYPTQQHQRFPLPLPSLKPRRSQRRRRPRRMGDARP